MVEMIDLPPFESIQRAVQQDLMDDVGTGDISAELIPAEKQAQAQIITREAAVVCGIPWVNEVFRQLDSRVELSWQVHEGSLVKPNQVLVYLQGPSRALLTGERTALNWLQTLSAVATKVRTYADMLTHTKVKLLDTRKTIPGLRLAEKYAVRCGGGHNHRMGLHDAYLIKENHIMAYGSITQAVAQARINHPNKVIEVEVENLEQLDEALGTKVEMIMLDNFNLEDMVTASRMTNGFAKLEASGNVTLESLAIIAATGVNYISVGELSKSIKAIDLSMRFVDASPY